MGVFARTMPGLAQVLLTVAAVVPLPAQVQNLAARSAGGELVFFTSQYNSSDWRADQLIDGSANGGWAGQSNGAQAVVIAFKGRGLAEVADVVINPYTRESNTTWAKDVEIQVSTTYPFRDFVSVGRFTLVNEGRDQVFSFTQPTRVRYLKVIFHTNYGGTYMEAGEIKVMGRLLPDAPPALRYTDVAAAERGGRIERFAGEYNSTTWAAANLLAPDGGDQWAGKSAGAQEVVIALPQVVPITDIAINNYAKEAPTNWVREADVEISASSSYKGFQPVGKLRMAPVGDLHTISLASPMDAQYVKVIFQSNGGGGYMEAARIRVFQAETAAGGETVAAQLKATGRAVWHGITFGTNSAAIVSGSEAVLHEIAELLRSNPDWELTIEGHTDDVGTAESNLALSQKRADAVKKWLVEQERVAAVRLNTVGYGMTKPIDDNRTEEGRARNRRVELVRKGAT